MNGKDLAVRAEVLKTLSRSSWNVTAMKVIADTQRAALLEFVRTFSFGPGLSDVSRQAIEDIGNAVSVLDGIGALPLVRGEVQSIIDTSRGEVWDRYTREDFVKRLGRERSPVRCRPPGVAQSPGRFHEAHGRVGHYLEHETNFPGPRICSLGLPVAGR
ncbi:MAG: hypothetical protein Q8N26_16920 [Myxococcales bacterium]|nr:hypothetical protein [Myxococcales bacterium]